MKGIFVVGTDTGVGKTLVAGILCRFFKKAGLKVGACKPVETGGVEDGRFLKYASDDPSPIEDVVFYNLDEPVCPYVASKLSGVSVYRGDILSRFKEKLRKYDVVICEGAGGLMVPVGDGFTILDVVRDFGLPALVVTRSSLGAINHTLLTVERLLLENVPVIGVVINHMRKHMGLAEKTLKDVLSKVLQVDIVGELPYLGEGVSLKVLDSLERFLDMERLSSFVSMFGSGRGAGW